VHLSVVTVNKGDKMDVKKAVCKKYEADFLASHNDLKLGIAFNVKELKQ